MENTVPLHMLEILLRSTFTAITTIAGGQTYTPGCYSTLAAINTAANTNITLDAEGDPNAVFVIAANAALGFGADSYVVLRNGTTYENVFWVINGAIGVGARSILQGTTLNVGAFSLGVDAKLCGRALVPGGALNMAPGSSIIVDDCDL
eukprot:scaffold421342_cov60-Attheya_sp.AAC.5